MGTPCGRLGDIGSNHGCWYATPIVSGSGNVIVNGRPCAKVGSALVPHGNPCIPAGPHGRAVGSGSPSVIVNGSPCARIGSAISCGGAVVTGSGNVIVA